MSKDKPARWMYVDALESWQQEQPSRDGWVARFLGMSMIDEPWLRTALQYKKCPTPSMVFHGMRTPHQVVILNSFRKEAKETAEVLSQALLLPPPVNAWLLRVSTAHFSGSLPKVHLVSKEECAQPAPTGSVFGRAAKKWSWEKLWAKL